ncbi:MAG TPA: hypothetical protein VJQ84_00030, partial [Solirubrobacterales bacterium]|nr:hypothetical protein [Solirubrobacterales bacterium]
PIMELPPGKTGPKPAPVNWYWLIWARDGSLVSAYAGVTTGSLSLTIGPADLSDPGDIGPVPAPTTDVLIPNDSPSILVGCGQAKEKNGKPTYLTRSQFWKRSGDSITLAPGESVMTSYTSTTGIQETSSTTETVATSLNASASAGWGPVSASISAGLNTSSTSFQQYVSTQTDTRFESRTYAPDPNSTRMIFRWQLYDVVSVTAAAGNKVLAQVTTAQLPDVVKVYSDKELLPAEAPAEISEAEQHQLNELLAELQAASG